jgi:hypothetical protein
MNDKFLEILSKSSGRTITRPYDGSLLIKLDLPELEKYTKLIIRECMEQCFREGHPRIAKHFGIYDEW